MRTIYISSILIWWLAFLFGRTQAQTVHTFCSGNINGDIEVSAAGHLWGIVHIPGESGFAQLGMDASVMHLQTYPGRNFRHIAVNADFVFLTDPENNIIYKYTHAGQYVDSIIQVDNPGNVFPDNEGNIYVIETDFKRIAKFNPAGVKSVVVSDPWLYKNIALTGDPEGNLFTANRFTGQIFRWEKESEQLYLFAQLPVGTLCADGSQVSELVYTHGKLYAASVGQSAIYCINEFGEVSLLAGSPGISQEVNDIGNKARFVKPMAIAASLSGDTLFVTDNEKVRMITDIHVTAHVTEAATNQEVRIYPNPATDHVQVRFENGGEAGVNWRLLNTGGQTVENGQAFPAGGVLSLRFATRPAGTYYLELTDPKSGQHTVRALVLGAAH